MGSSSGSSYRTVGPLEDPHTPVLGASTMSNTGSDGEKRGRVERFIKKMKGNNQSGRKELEQLPERDDRADWDADDSGVHSAGFNYETDRQTLEYDFKDVRLHLETSLKRGVVLTAMERDTFRNVRVCVDAETADQLAEQFELAAEMLRDGKSADIRL